MSDRGLPVRFGFFPEPVAADPAGVVEDVLLAERLGYDLVGIQDHPYNPHYLDTMTLLAVLAARTTRIGLFPDVASLPLRPPAVLAKSAASLDLLSGGRFDLGLGAGAIWPAIGAYGGPQRSAGEAVAALEEAIRVLRLLWSDERSVRLHGAHYRLDGAHPGPRPSRAIGVWIGAYGPRMLALTGRLADGWLPSAAFLPPDKLGDAQRRLDDAATAAGRPPEAVRRIYNISGEITDGTDRAFLQGPVKRWVDELSTLVLEAGVDTFVLWASEPRRRQMEIFADEVMPAVRAAVDAARSDPASADHDPAG
jgi:alkanesulfonate monooxygenase SsuD/methylene tetrahydromethanopterin reductase-like flavin-dependent oxidoreductase (luciferase family)